MQKHDESVTTDVCASVPVAEEAIVIGISEKDQNLSTKIVEEDVSMPSHPPKRSTIKSITIVAACTGTQILNVAAGAGVGMALPSMARELDMSSDRIPWIVSAFTLTSGCLLLLLGRLADIYGRKLVWLIGAVWTVTMSIGCSFAQTSMQIIVLRALAGAGPAATVPAAIGILAQSFPPSRARSTAFATFSAGAPIGGVFGQVFGGVLTQYATWRGLFWFLAGLGTLVLILGILAIDHDSKSQKKDDRVDWVGAFIVTTGLTLISFALGDAASAGWSSPLIVSLLVIGVVVLALFLGWEYYLVHYTSFPPLMPLDIWTRDHGRFAAIQVVGFMEWACFTNLGMYAMLYYQNYLGLSPLHAMYRFLPMPITGIICNVIVALVVGTINGAYLLGLGVASTTTAALLFAFIDPKASFWQYGFPAGVICVLGADFAFAVGILFIAKIAHPHEQSVAGAILQTIMALGTSFSLSISTISEVAGMQHEAKKLGITLVENATAAQIPGPVLLKGYRMAQVTGAAFGAFGLLVVVVFLNRIGIVGTTRKPNPPPPEKDNTA